MTDKNINIPAHGSSVSRSDIPAECKWRVENIYAGEAQWQQACAAFKEKLPRLQALQGTLNTAQSLYTALKLQDEMSQELDKIYAYARLQQDADAADQQQQ